MPVPDKGIEHLESMKGNIPFEDLKYLCVTKPFATLVDYMLPYMSKDEVGKTSSLVDDLDRMLDEVKDFFKTDEIWRIIVSLQSHDIQFHGAQMKKFVERKMCFAACKLISDGRVKQAPFLYGLEIDPLLLLKQTHNCNSTFKIIFSFNLFVENA